MGSFNHISVDISDGMLQVSREQLMSYSTVHKINGLVFVMGCNEPFPLHIGKHKGFFVANLFPHPFLDFCF
jgi:hypothetical protein